ncbi:sulfatase [bacterium]|nr:sulfatase [candidate division CSSED10-310 bacterium]
MRKTHLIIIFLLILCALTGTAIILRGRHETPREKQPETGQTVVIQAKHAAEPARILSTLAPARRSRPNLLLITIDTLRADHLGCYGHVPPTSPNINRLARQGYQLEVTRCNIPITTPSHATIHTGLHPIDHGSTMNCQPIYDSTATIASILSTHGYHTGAIVSSAVLTARASGLSAGFDYYDDATNLPPRQSEMVLDADQPIPANPPATNGNKERVLFAGGLGPFHDQVRPFERRANKATDLALDWINQTQAPFFLWLHYFDPHATYDPPPVYSGMFEQFYSKYGSVLDVIKRKAEDPPLNLADNNGFYGYYDGEIRFTDHHLGRLLTRLAQLELLDSTIIMLTADHGETLGEYADYVGHGAHLNMGSVRVPLILRVPDTPGRTTLPVHAESIDVLPTILDILDIPPVTELPGMSLWKKLHDTTPAARTTFMHTALQPMDDGHFLRLGLVRYPYKYVARADTARSDIFPNGYIKTETMEDSLLYDLAADPAERHDLHEEASAEMEQYRTEIRNRIDSRPFFIPAPESLSDEDREALRALGYAQ